MNLRPHTFYLFDCAAAEKGTESYIPPRPIYVEGYSEKNKSWMCVCEDFDRCSEADDPDTWGRCMIEIDKPENNENLIIKELTENEIIEFKIIFKLLNDWDLGEFNIKDKDEWETLFEWFGASL